MALWQEVVNMEGGPSQKNQDIDLVASQFRQVLDEVGAAIRTVCELAPAGNMLIAEFSGRITTPGVLFLGHMDTAIAAAPSPRQPLTIPGRQTDRPRRPGA